MFATIVLGLAASLLVTLPTQPVATTATDPSADLSVAVQARTFPILNGVNYTISVANHGPDAVESATVVLTLDIPFFSSTSGNCVADTAQRRFTCAFGPLPAGAVATVSPTAYLLGASVGTGHFTTTATRTASAPADPNPANDSVALQCSYTFQPMPPAPPYWIVGCS